MRPPLYALFDARTIRSEFALSGQSKGVPRLIVLSENQRGATSAPCFAHD
jgi:hypothetical protein